MSCDKGCYIEYKHYGTTIRFSGLEDDMDMEAFHEQCKLLALAIGYHPRNVEEWFEHE